MNPRRIAVSLMLVLVAGVVVVGIGCKKAPREELPEWLIPMRTSYQNALARIRPDDGIDETEALQIAMLYMGEYISGCGGPEPPVFQGGRWRVPLRIGLTGKGRGVIEIGPNTGAVRSPGGPTFKTFGAFARDLVDGMADRRR